MNKIFKTGAVLFSLMLLTTACEDFLNKLPENKVPTTDVDFSKVSEMYEPVSGVYAKARSGEGFSFWGALGLIEVRSDDVEKGGAPNDQVEFNYCKNFQYDRIKDFWALNSAWSGFYKTVEVSNAALISLDNYKEYITTSADSANYEQYTAEVRFIRAFAHFLSARLWGDIPIMTNNQAVGLTKTPREQVYEFINEEMEYCIKRLPALRPNEMVHKGAVSKYTAFALQAKAAADVNKWDIVLAATDSIIDSNKFSLYTDYYQLFKKPGRLCNESLFELQYSDFGQGTGDIVVSDNWFAFQGAKQLAGLDNVPMDGGWGFMTPTQTLINVMKARNETNRYVTTILFTGEVTPSGDTIAVAQVGEPTQYSGKAYLPGDQLTPGRKGYGEGNNIRMIRYADILLLNSEAKIRKGQSGDYGINEVRKRAGFSTPISGATLENVREERRIELACEWGERYFDLVRWIANGEISASVLPGYSPDKRFYPIPQNQIDLNPNLQ
ncbi:MAG: RagB/SusD family nutrient uptake outer membrane protein [Bacteroidales bacterium]|nr:RagB/SusD family nutrient uptake outer membrane protein [Bacteroidales bacterium]